MHWTAWPFMLSIAALPVLGLLVFLKVIRKDREELPWENAATYVAYGVLAILLASIVLGKFIFD
jgi:cytochrome bd-type quinol oxidase subunit 2